MIGEASDRPRNVLHVLAGHLLGGADRYAITLAAGLRRDFDYHSSFAFLSEGSGAEAARQAGFPVYVVGKAFRADLRCVARLATVARESRARMLHSHTFGTNFYASLTALTAWPPQSMPLVYTVHGFDFKRPQHAEAVPWRSRLALLQDRATLCRVQRVMVVSEHTRAILLRCGYPPHKLTLVRNAVEAPACLEAVQRAGREIRAGLNLQNVPTIGTVGRMVSVKSQLSLIQAVDLLRRRKVRVAALLVGDGPLRSALEEAVQRLELSDQVHFLGIRPDAVSVIAGLDAFCLPSLYEGMPLSLLEAMSVVTPVIAPAVGGVLEIVTHRETGLLVPPGDPVALAEAVQHVTEDAVAARQMAERAAEMVKDRFSYHRMLAEVAQVYDECWHP